MIEAKEAAIQCDFCILTDRKIKSYRYDIWVQNFKGKLFLFGNPVPTYQWNSISKYNT